MNKKIVRYLIVFFTLSIFTAYKIVDSAWYLKFSEYTVPGYPVGGSDNETIYEINPQNILSFLENDEFNVFTLKPSAPENSLPVWENQTFNWNQDDYLRIANALHETVWKEALDGWSLKSATFHGYKREVNSGFEYAHFVFYKHQNDVYTVHTLTIKPLFNEVIAGEGIYNDAGNWRGFDLKNLKVKSANQALSIADQSGGEKACSNIKKVCGIGIWLTSYLDEFKKILSLPIYRYDWKWSVSYYDEYNHTIFSVDINPYDGTYRVNSQ
jgi:hypothetical protein